MDLGLKEKIILITGGAGSRGSIGETIVKALAQEGAIPVILDRNDRGHEYARELNEAGTDATFYQLDLTSADSIKEAVTSAIEKYGRIDAVINNVGVNDGVGLDASPEEFMHSLKLNMVSYFLTVKYALPKLKESKGSILNVGSKVAVTGQGGTSGYAASKGGVLALTREWAVDLINDGIRVNALMIAECFTPAYDNWLKTLANPEDKLNAITSKIPLGRRMTTTNEIADTVLFLISGRSSHTTGQYVFVDGGYVHLDRALLTEN
ncbi:SDR family oxidoreductase [Fulvivirgaceae bacterium BMA12]|uniref:SDR family oxidoreductase n=1 Tax=Agaribacillus aureus TaxID=3051825 RepID=A0ABT8LJH3_9BACT|nr:SDR family oxidoreductase [Fulvivirgaceae bacterium BMA12]